MIVGIGLVGSQLQQPSFNLVIGRATAASQLGLGFSVGQFFALLVLSLQQFLLSFLQFVENSILFLQLFSQLAIFLILVNQKFNPARHISVILFLADGFGTLQLSLPIFLHSCPEITIYFQLSFGCIFSFLQFLSRNQIFSTLGNFSLRLDLFSFGHFFVFGAEVCLRLKFHFHRIGWLLLRQVAIELGLGL